MCAIIIHSDLVNISYLNGNVYSKITPQFANNFILFSNDILNELCTFVLNWNHLEIPLRQYIELNYISKYIKEFVSSHHIAKNHCNTHKGQRKTVSIC